MKHSLLLLLLVFSIGILAACESTNDFSNEHPQLVATPDVASGMLAEAATRASKALETLAAVEYAQEPSANLSPIGNAPPELKRAVTVSWVGPVEPIIKTLADRAGYSFLSIGARPAVPVVVTVNAENKMLLDVMRDIGLQLGSRADIKVDGDRRIVEVHYPPNTGPIR